MTRKKDPDYVVKGKNGGYDVQVPVVHPPYCVCRPCRNLNNRPANSWGNEIIIRTRRRSSHPKDYKRSIFFAETLKKQLERELREAVTAAEDEGKALGAQRTVGDVCAYYLVWQFKENKSWSRDQYRVLEIERLLGHDHAAEKIGRQEYDAFREALRGRNLKKASVRRYVNVLFAIFNRAVKAGLMEHHGLSNLERPKPDKNRKKPVILTSRQLAVLLGSAMDAYERAQGAQHRAYDPDSHQKPPSVIPLRGLCLIAICTAMRPSSNFGLRWEDLTIDPHRDRGRFHLQQHKNTDKGVEVNAPLKPELVRYLRNIMPSRARGLVHPNPETGKAFVNIRAQWAKLIRIANGVLEPDEQLVGRSTHFYILRHTAASLLAASSKDPTMVARVMGDRSLRTILDSYFDSPYENMEREIEKWQLPREDRSADGQGDAQARFESAIESGPN
jgi:integrase